MKIFLPNQAQQGAAEYFKKNLDKFMSIHVSPLNVNAKALAPRWFDLLRENHLVYPQP
jgi:hypothetical protein